jgi:hypothetical protein
MANNVYERSFSYKMHVIQNACNLRYKDSNLVHEMSLRQKGTYARPQDKARGLNIHDGK